MPCDWQRYDWRAAHQRVGSRDETMILADYEFWTRALRYGCRFGLIPAPLLMRRRHEQNLKLRRPDACFCRADIRNAKKPDADHPDSRATASGRSGYRMGYDPPTVFADVGARTISNVGPVVEFRLRECRSPLSTEQSSARMTPNCWGWESISMRQSRERHRR